MNDAPPIVVDVENSEKDLLTALSLSTRAANRMTPAWQQFLLKFAFGFLLIVPVFLLVQLTSQSTEWVIVGSPIVIAWLPLLWLILFSSLSTFWQRLVLRNLARRQQHNYRLTLKEDGLEVVTESAQTFFRWSAIEKVERQAGGLACYTRAGSVLYLPWRSFAYPDERERFITVLQAASGIAIEYGQGIKPAEDVGNVERADAASNAVGEKISLRARCFTFVSRFFSNLAAGVLFAFFQRSAVARLRVSGMQLIALLLAVLLLKFSYSVVIVGTTGQFAWDALPYQFWGMAWFFICVLVVARIARNEASVLAAMQALIATSIAISLFGVCSYLLPGSFWKAVEWAGSAWYLVFDAWLGMAITVALIRVCGVARLLRRIGVLVAVLLLINVPYLLTSSLMETNYSPPQLWSYRYDEPDSLEAKARRERREMPRKEAVLYAQPRLLDEALARVAPSRPGATSLYLVAFGGYGREDVFLREVNRVDQLFAERFGTEGRSVVLVNNPTTVLERPIASVTALERTLKTVGERMNRDEDVLFLFMTSHGAANFSFSLELWPYVFDDLTPQRLLKMLDDSGIKNRVIVVSACYSGGFVPILAGDHTLVMSASSKDRNSYGCSNEEEWTFFGRAYFDEALRHTDSFEEAFSLAKKAIAEREQAEEYKPSDPQISVGKDIGEALKRLQASHIP